MHILIKTSVLLDHGSELFTNAHLSSSVTDHFYLSHSLVSVPDIFCLSISTFQLSSSHG